MKFKDMKYERPDVEAIKTRMAELTEAFENAEDYDKAKEVFLEVQEMSRHTDTRFTLASIRHSIDTRDEFYDQENDFSDMAGPELAESDNVWTKAVLKSRFRKELEEDYGKTYFLNAELEERSFKPELIPLMQKENELSSEYDKLIASAQIEFRGETLTLSQLSPHKSGR